MERQEFACRSCGRTFGSSYDVERHYKEFHSASEPYRATRFNLRDEYIRDHSKRPRVHRTPDPFEYLLSSG